MRGGASLVKREPVFSSDGKRLLVCTACTVTVYSVATGLVVTQLRGHTGCVTSVVVVPGEALRHAWSASQDGTVRLWDYATGALLRTVEVGHPIFSMVIPDLCKAGSAGKTGKSDGKLRNLVAFLSVSWSKEKEQQEEWIGRVVCHNLTTGKPIIGHLAKTPFPQILYVSRAGGMVGISDLWKVWVWKVPHGSMDSASAIPCTILHHKRTLTVLAFDVTETRVAGGDQSGRILLWVNVGERRFATSDGNVKVPGRKGPVSQKRIALITEGGAGVRGDDDAGALTTYHWHAHEVKFLLFSSDGLYLLSGGLEGVLVIWQLETGKRQFLPRLGGPLVSIAAAPNPSVYAIACMDNAIKFVNIGTMEIERSIQGVKPPFPLQKGLILNSSRASIEPREGKIVLPTHNLSLQFYDAASDQHVMDVQVAPRNYVSSAKNDREGPSTFVTHVAFSKDGSCMASVDIRIAEQDIGGGACLRFWDRQHGKLEYAVNTQVDEPHEITSLSFHSQELMAVSCSDTNFKVWLPIERKRFSKLRWRCRSVGSYRKKSMLAAAFSPDGSILAVAASELITLWNPSTNGLIRVLSNTILSQPINHLAFVNHSNCLVGASAGAKPLLTLWDLSTLSVRWNQSIRVESLAVDPAGASFAVLAGVPSAIKNEGLESKMAFLALFGVESPAPLRYWTIQDGVGGTVLFLPDSQSSTDSPPVTQGDDSETTGMELVTTLGKSSLAVITKGREFALFNPYQDEEEHEEPVAKSSQIFDPVYSSAFTAVYGKTPKRKEAASSDMLSSLGRAPWGNLLEGPSHVLPPLSVVCIPFMESLMKKRTDK